MSTRTAGKGTMTPTRAKSTGRGKNQRSSCA